MEPLYAETTGGEKVPSGTYLATSEALEDLGQKAFGNFPAKHYIRLFWHTDPCAGKPEGYKLSVLYNLNAAVTSNLRKDATQILGRDPGNRFDVTQLVGLKRMIVVADDPKPDGRTFSKVVAVLPLPGQAQPAVPAPQPSTIPPNGQDTGQDPATRVIQAVRNRQAQEQATEFNPQNY